MERLYKKYREILPTVFMGLTILVLLLVIIINSVSLLWGYIIVITVYTYLIYKYETKEFEI